MGSYKEDREHTQYFGKESRAIKSKNYAVSLPSCGPNKIGQAPVLWVGGAQTQEGRDLYSFHSRISTWQGELIQRVCRAKEK